MEEELNVAANVEETATPQENIEVNSENTEITTEPTETTQELTQTQAFSKRLKEETAKAAQTSRDSFIAEQNYMWNDKPITTETEYKQAMREQELIQQAEAQGKDPQEALWKANVENQLKTRDEQLSAYEMKEKNYAQDEQLSNDPKIGTLYKEWKTDVKDIASQYNVDYDTAFTILARERLADVLSKSKIATEQEVIKGLNQNALSTPGALNGDIADHKTSISNMSSADFEKMLSGIKRGEITSI